MDKAMLDVFFKSIGQRVCIRRKEAGLSTHTLAQHTGISEAQLIMYETGLDDIPLSHLIQISAGLNIPTGWFFIDLYSDLYVSNASKLPHVSDSFIMDTLTTGAVTKNIGLRIQIWRKTMMLTAAALGLSVGLSQQQISRNEHGKNRIHIDHLVNIALALGIPLSWFFIDCHPDLEVNTSSHLPTTPTKIMDKPELELMAKNIGQRIRVRRKKLNVTLQGLAKQAGMNQQTLSRYETGKKRITSTDLVIIAIALNTPIDWFFIDYSSLDDDFPLTSLKSSDSGLFMDSYSKI
ncbi:helix-turn-helix transcriptional regulator [Xenorhabdus nematophila]|uniref:helix-turn-helix domain-containing protein n=1 Tax=Xenorhabdus nematophila TaxID=628 RepID=UPI0032B7AEC8